MRGVLRLLLVLLVLLSMIGSCKNYSPPVWDTGPVDVVEPDSCAADSLSD